MKCIIVTGKNFEDLVLKVNNAIRQGYNPLGGHNSEGMSYSQAMIKKK